MTTRRYPVLDELKARLVADGFVARRGGVLTQQLGDGWHVWLSLGFASRKGKPGDRWLDPTVGITQDAINRYVSSAFGGGGNPFGTYLIGGQVRFFLRRALGERPVLPADWFIEPARPDPDIVESVLASIRDTALPEVTGLASPRALGRELTQSLGSNRNRDAIAPLAYWLDRDGERALELTGAFMRRWGVGEGDFARSCKDFADQLQKDIERFVSLDSYMSTDDM